MKEDEYGDFHFKTIVKAAKEEVFKHITSQYIPRTKNNRLKGSKKNLELTENAVVWILNLKHCKDKTCYIKQKSLIRQKPENVVL